MNLKITVSIDDVHPQKGWRVLGDQSEKWLRSLNEEFGTKFTLFIPSNYHQAYPLSKHKEWVNELASLDWIELAAHGHFHQTSNPKRFGECEMLELDTLQKCHERYSVMISEWSATNILPTGWKNPGWLCHHMWNDFFKDYFLTFDSAFFEYVSLHYEHNHGMKWNCKSFFGHDGIQQENISIHNVDESGKTGMIMFTSHIAGTWNHNVWNQENYEQLRISLRHLVENHDCEFKTLEKC